MTDEKDPPENETQRDEQRYVPPIRPAYEPTCCGSGCEDCPF